MGWMRNENGLDKKVGEMESNKKHAIGHRANAFASLLARCFDNRLDVRHD